MNTRIEREPGLVKNRTTVEQMSEREVVVTRTINGPARIVFEAFSKAELLKRWWVPKSMGMTLLSCAVDARVGGKYRLEFDVGGPEPAAFFGTYVEVKPYSRLAWTNDEGGEGGPITTVTFEETGSKTLVVLHERYPSQEALDAAGTGSADAMVETFDQLDALLVSERLAHMRANRPWLVQRSTLLLHQWLFCGACIVVWSKHAQVFDSIGMHFLTYWQQCWQAFASAMRGVQQATYASRLPQSEA